uniref:Uncharacterized protein n=1 Tax=viral metagenome TaxID=1070528 RepID=A0A6C0M2D9_9ZZZZ
MSATEEIDLIRNTANMIKAFINTDEVQHMKRRKGFEHYKNHLINIFPSFYEDFETLFNMIIEEKDTKFLDHMLDGLEDIENGKSRETVEKDLGEQLASKYLYPKINK